ncbi:MAG: endo-1,4-beta-xylanase [Opitutaceae bacterium]|jgi:endo-1,4-beta-xylanase
MNNTLTRKHLGAAWDVAWQHPYQTPFLGSLFDAVESGDTGAWNVMAPNPTVQRVEALDAMMRCARNRSLQVLHRCWAYAPQLPKWLDPKDANVRLRYRLQTMTHRYLRKGRWLEAGRQVDDLPGELWPDDETRNGPPAKKMEWLLKMVHLINVHPWIPAKDTHFLWGEQLTAEREPFIAKFIEDAGGLRRDKQHLLDGVCLTLKDGEHFEPDKLRKILDEAHQRDLVVWITELTVHETDDQLHKNLFSALLNEIWQHPAVVGVTLGDIEEPQAFNKQKSESCLVRWDRSERPAFTWLREFVAGQRTPGTRVLTGPSLGELSQRLSRPFGSALHLEEVIDPGDKEFYIHNKVRESSLLGSVNAFKMVSPSGEMRVWRGPREYDFDIADEHLALATNNGLPFRANVLMFCSGVPNWLKTGQFSPDEVQQMLKEYILTIVNRYKGRVLSWDVDNAAIYSPLDAAVFGFSPNKEKPMEIGWRESFWREKLGVDYMPKIFQWAHEADPEAVLFYSDGAIESVNAKSNWVYEMLARFVKQGVPVHGIAFESHYPLGEIRSNLCSIEENVRRFASLGLKVHFSEVDVRMRLPADYNRLLLQADEYRDLVELYLRMPEVSAFLIWDHEDERSWIRRVFPGWGAPGLFANHDPKPAYFAIQDAFLRKAGALGLT